MKNSLGPYSIPKSIEADLARLRAYWESLKRGQNDIPFADDVKVSALPDLSDRLMLVDVFEKPERYRFSIVGQQIVDRYGSNIAGQFADEIDPHNPLDYFRSQCSATLESRLPTYFRPASTDPSGSRVAGAYARILLPMWGDGHIVTLLGAMVWL